MTYKFTIIIPIYNEVDNLERLEKELLQYLKMALIPTKILLINDGSTDKSQQHIETICERHSAFGYICFTKNYGLSAALKAGFDEVDTALIGYMDADLQTHPADFNLLLEHRDNYDLITGLRTNRTDGLLKKWSSQFANRGRQLFTKDAIHDTCCPLKVIATPYAKRVPMFRGLHRFLPAMILLQKGRIKQIEISHYPRIAGTTSFGFWNRSCGPLLDCFAYLWMKKNYINYTVSKKST
ncbi:MAG: glycosyltransferase family 2 protein [Psychroserpens sp.]|uniref:glycosyltransferase family 2 protein n=1 Tax=Psychroserpens sp. TaxID=2020870 RepID=UPI003C74CF52